MKNKEHKQIDLEKAYAANREAGEQFLEENKSKDGVVVLDSGLQYKINFLGDGSKPNRNDKIKVHYTGKLIDGTIFDSSRGKPLEMKLKNLIDGWKEALQLMPVGSKWTLYIPHYLGYDKFGSGVIGPFSALIFDIELISCKK